MNILKLGFYEDLGQISGWENVQRILNSIGAKNEMSRKCPKKLEHIN